MATIVKIKGLERGSAPGDGSATAGSYRGFRVPVGNLGTNYLGGTSVKANLTIGTLTNGVVYTSKIGGAAGNNIEVAVVSSGGGSAVLSVVTTYAATTGYPTITITAGSATAASALVTAVNADATASQYISAAPFSTGAGTTLAAAAAAPLENGDNGTGTAEIFALKVTNKAPVLVDVDDPKVQRVLKRNPGRYISLGAVV